MGYGFAGEARGEGVKGGRLKVKHALVEVILWCWVVWGAFFFCGDGGERCMNYAGATAL